MKFSVDKNTLTQALSAVMLAVGSDSTQPTLACVHLTALQDSLKLEATNLTISIKTSVNALVEEGGDVAIPGRVFAAFIRNLPENVAQFELVDNHVVVHCGSTSFSLICLSQSDLPQFPYFENGVSIQLPLSVLQQLGKHVLSLGLKRSEASYGSSVALHIKDNMFTIQSMDNYRVMVCSYTTENSVPEQQFSLPVELLQTITALPANNLPITLSVFESNVTFTCGDTVIVGQKLDILPVDISPFTAAEVSTTVRVNRDELLNALKRTSLLKKETTPIVFEFNTTDQSITLTASDEQGKITECIKASIDGNSLTIGFNNTFLLPGISSCPGNEIVFQLSQDTKPGILRDSESDTYIFIAMPVRIR